MHHNNMSGEGFLQRAGLAQTPAFVLAGQPNHDFVFLADKPHCGLSGKRTFVANKFRSVLSAISVLFVGILLTCLPVNAAPFEKCVGKNPCTACKNCASCAHCAVRVNGKLLRGKAFVHLREKFCGRCEPLFIVKGNV
jgi:hypothetical protein